MVGAATPRRARILSCAFNVLQWLCALLQRRHWGYVVCRMVPHTELQAASLERDTSQGQAGCQAQPARLPARLVSTARGSILETMPSSQPQEPSQLHSRKPLLLGMSNAQFSAWAARELGAETPYQEWMVSRAGVEAVKGLLRRYTHYMQERGMLATD